MSVNGFNSREVFGVLGSNYTSSKGDVYKSSSGGWTSGGGPTKGVSPTNKTNNLLNELYRSMKGPGNTGGGNRKHPKK